MRCFIPVGCIILKGYLQMYSSPPESISLWINKGSLIPRDVAYMRINAFRKQWSRKWAPSTPGKLHFRENNWTSDDLCPCFQKTIFTGHPRQSASDGGKGGTEIDAEIGDPHSHCISGGQVWGTSTESSGVSSVKRPGLILDQPPLTVAPLDATDTAQFNWMLHSNSQVTLRERLCLDFTDRDQKLSLLTWLVQCHGAKELSPTLFPNIIQRQGLPLALGLRSKLAKWGQALSYSPNFLNPSSHMLHISFFPCPHLLPGADSVTGCVFWKALPQVFALWVPCHHSDVNSGISIHRHCPHPANLVSTLSLSHAALLSALLRHCSA